MQDFLSGDGSSCLVHALLIERRICGVKDGSLMSGRFANRRVLTLDEAAEYCGLTRDSFKKKVVRDRLRKVRLDKCWRFDISDLDAWIDEHKEQIAAETAA